MVSKKKLHNMRLLTMEIVKASKDPDVTPSVSVIIVTKSFPNANLDEMLDSTRKFSFKYEVIIVSSTVQNETDAKSYLLELFKALPNLIKGKVALTDNDKGVSYGRNIGALLAESPNLLFADDDIIVTEDVTKLLQYLESNACQGAQPLTLKFSSPEIVDSAGDFMKKDKRGILYVPYSRGKGKPITDLSGDLYVEEIPSMRSAFMIVKKTAFLVVGGFDTTFNFGYEDVDFGWRMTIAGYRLLFVPDIKVLHKGGRSADSQRSDNKAEILHLVNYYIMQLKVTHNVLPYILLQFYKRMIVYEVWKIRKMKAGFKETMKDILTIHRLFIKRAKFAAAQKKYLAKFLLREEHKFREFSKGKRFMYTEHG